MLGILECIGWAVLPALLGWLWELSARVSGFAAALVTFGAIAGAYFGGWRYSRKVKCLPLALVLGNSVGILSLGVYLWQEYLTREKVNWLQALSQKFPAAMNLISVRLVARFSPVVDGVTQVSNTALQGVGFVLVAGLFTVGYLTGRRAGGSGEGPR